ncbi:hypothetical protein AJ79_03159 [Helicocarpus griseus UAMH5409]|uniref:Uncharacterized protein n=1 Tax=Helicocarpus griseus UAMH5409 TaxID=1447875 RepID=A0A2B7XY98_9EURO|nr:hypothetical protein AJ79_03159 [Helicocarpus griseus UAMH5409]
MTKTPWQATLTKAHRDHHVAKWRPGFGQVFLLGEAELPSTLDNVYPPDNLLEQAWGERVNGWEFAGMGMPADEYYVSAWVVLFDAVNDFL